ncbi:glycosyltransferase family 4 protein [Phaeodactylibacter xiamenensis]|uniref:glycosyltransferase family 4 protein n=1 Tax=Phaeodactylibacter xiamenensis TaxID=1524460 RepID=UPI0024A9321E|nr:glycosyltransferase family 1 protein [Phaeodactylibacter xiamenensis]
MRIGIEGQRLFRPKKHGMDMVALELIKNLQEIDHENEYIIFVKPDEDNTCIPEAPNFKIVELSAPGGYPVWEQWALPRAARQQGCDLLHCTSNTGPLRSKVPLMITLHDIIYMEKLSLFQKGSTWYQRLGNVYRRFVVPPVLKRSKCVITVSNFEKDRINEFFGLKPGKLTAVYNGVSPHFRKVTDPDLLLNAREKYRLPERFLFFLGNTAPKKNTPGVLKAFADFNAKQETPYYLVMLDYEEAKLQQILRDIGHPGLRAYIHLTGYVPNVELPAIISQAKLFLYPSLRESFGIPILEGMACGVPVITSNTSSMPEVAGGEALLVDPFQPAEITAAIEQLLNNEALYQSLSERGPKRAAQFSWRAMAEQVLELYQGIHQKTTVV